MSALLALVLVSAVSAAEPAVDAVSAASPGAAPEPPSRVYVLGKLGWFQPVGAQALLSLADARGPRWDLDLLVEPSRYWQSMSLGGGFRPLHNALTLGARARWIQQHPPWSRGYVFALDNALALGPEIAGRWTLGAQDRLMISLAVGGVFSPWGRAALPPMFTLDLGVGWRVANR
jgi:hypothetical protein